MRFEDIIKDAPLVIQRKLEQLKFLRERPDFHPEPSTFHHIEIVTNRLITTGDMNLILAGVLHDICKFDTVKMNEKTGWPTSPGHDKHAELLIRDTPDIKSWIIKMGGNSDKVAIICGAHMRFHQLGQMRPAKHDAQLQLWKDQGIFDQLHIFGAADNMLVEFDLHDLEKSWKFNC